MSEFCLECLNKYVEKKLTEKDVKLSEDLYEECGEWKLRVIAITKRSSKRCFLWRSFFHRLDIFRHM